MSTPGGAAEPPHASRPAGAVSATDPANPTAVGAVATPAERGAPEPAAVLTGMAQRLVPLAVASALFMEFIDSTSLSTALPTLARAFAVDPIHLKLALTSYILTLAVVAPASGWVADRFGARRVFLLAMGVFLLGSALCGASRSLEMLIGARVIQGLGGAMMTPVARLIVVGSSPRERLVTAMGWFTTPALVGPLIGPPLAGLILGVADWPWIFYVNLPVGLLGMAAVARWVPHLPQPDPGRFDTLGFVLAATAITTLVIWAETAGLNLMPVGAQLALLVTAVATGGLYIHHALNRERPVLDLGLLRHRSFRASLLGGTLVRVGVGASPFLTPLLFQVALGWSPFQAGLVTLSQGLGALAAKFIAPPALRRFGFRQVLLTSAVFSAVLTALPGVFDAATPIPLIMAGLAFAGVMRALQFTSASTVAYADVPNSGMTAASTLSTVVQQLGLALGISFGGLVLHLTNEAAGGAALTPDRFTTPFALIGIVAALSIPVYWRLDRTVGADISGKRA